jgi:tetratricopeptide (TPR) repeat protein
VHFQTAFLRNTDDIPAEIALARHHAERGVDLDPLDPFVNFTMGRTYWLEGDLDGSLGWLERSTAISPNYAHGIYARGWTEKLAGRGLEGRSNVDFAMKLSPLDPLYYAMLGTRALTHMTLGEVAEAAQWSERAARAPGAHVLIAMIAAAAQGMAGDEVRAAARAWPLAGWAAAPRRLESTHRRGPKPLLHCTYSNPRIPEPWTSHPTPWCCSHASSLPSQSVSTSSSRPSRSACPPSSPRC